MNYFSPIMMIIIIGLHSFHTQFRTVQYLQLIYMGYRSDTFVK